MAIARFSLLRAALLTAAIPLSAFYCAQTTGPLANRDDGFIDDLLVGDWYEARVSSDGLVDIGNRVLVVELGDSGVLRFEVLQGAEVGGTGADAALVFTGFSSRIEDDTYLSLKLVDVGCAPAEGSEEGCKDDKRRAALLAACTYQVLRYSRGLNVDDWTLLDQSGRERLGKEVERISDNLLTLSLMNVDMVKEAMRSGDLSGERRCDDCLWGGPCIEATADELQDFVAVQPGEFWDEPVYLLRPATEPEYLGEYRLGASRTNVLRQAAKEDGTTLVRYSMSQLAIIGQSGDADNEILRVFELHEGRLVGIEEQPLDNATVFERVAHEMRRPTPANAGDAVADRQMFETPHWETVGTFSSDEFALPLAACIEAVSRENQWLAAPPNELVAAGLLAQCMADKRYFLEVLSSSAAWQSW